MGINKSLTKKNVKKMKEKLITSAPTLVADPVFDLTEVKKIKEIIENNKHGIKNLKSVKDFKSLFCLCLSITKDKKVEIYLKGNAVFFKRNLVMIVDSDRCGNLQVNTRNVLRDIINLSLDKTSEKFTYKRINGLVEFINSNSN